MRRLDKCLHMVSRGWGWFTFVDPERRFKGERWRHPSRPKDEAGGHCNLDSAWSRLKRDGDGPVAKGYSRPMILDAWQVTTIRDATASAMRLWSPHPQRADYICAYCHSSPPTNHDEIEHAVTCDGTAILDILKGE